MKWDRLFLIISANLVIAMSIIILVEDKSIDVGVMFAILGIIIHTHYWKGGRLIIKIKEDKNER